MLQKKQIAHNNAIHAQNMKLSQRILDLLLFSLFTTKLTNSLPKVSPNNLGYINNYDKVRILWP